MAKNGQMYREELEKIIKAIENSDVDQFDKLMSDKQDINIEDEYGNPLFFHLLNSKNNQINLEMIKIFGQFGADFKLKNAKGHTLLNEIIKTKNIASTKAVLEWSPSLLVDIKDGYGEFPLQIAVKTDNENMVRLLAKFRANLDIEYKNGNILLGEEIITGNNSMASLLIELKVDCNKRNDQGETPLHLAVRHGRCTIVKKLLDTGANPYLTDGNGKKPLDCAFDEKKMHIIEALVQGGVQVDHPDQFGNTMLMRVVDVKDNDRYDHIMVNQLIRLGADYNVLNKKGKSIIKKLVENDDLNSLESILNSSLFNQISLNKEIIDKEGESWVKIAIKNENSKILELLLKNGISLPSGLSSDNPGIKNILEQYQAKPEHKALKKKWKKTEDNKENSGKQQEIKDNGKDLKKRQEKIKDSEEDENTDSNADSEDESSSNFDTDGVNEQLYSSNNVKINKIILVQENDNKTGQSFQNESTSTPFGSPDLFMDSSSRRITCQKQSVPINNGEQLVFADNADEGEQSSMSAVEEYKECPESPPDALKRKLWMESEASNSSSSFSNLPRLNAGGLQSFPSLTDEELTLPLLNEIGGQGSSFSDLDNG